MCGVYKRASKATEENLHIISVDEKTGIQALEHKHPSKPMEKGKIERIEHSYERHGTITMIANFDVRSGKILKPLLNETRTEKDFRDNIARLVKTDTNGEWVLIADQLNTHQSQSLVRLVAKECDIKVDLGEKGKRGILKSMRSRKEFLKDKSHRVRFVYTPKHSSWLNQVEIWFGIIGKKLLNRRSSFESVDKLRNSITEYIKYYNITAKPFKWTYQGMLLKC